jgi:hypothetical protein
MATSADNWCNSTLLASLPTEFAMASVSSRRSCMLAVATIVATVTFSACRSSPTAPERAEGQASRRSTTVCVIIGPDGERIGIPANPDGGCPAGYDLQTWH